MKASSMFIFGAVSAIAVTLLPAAFGQQLVNIDTVAVGDAGNAADANGFGSVSYPYRIGKFEITIGQYAAFLNAVARTDSFGLYDPNMASNTNIAGISRSGSLGSYSYDAIGPFGLKPSGASSSGNRPIAYVNWFDAARFCNWLHNGATNGANTETGAYTLEGRTNGAAVARNFGARWWIPTENEWYKAAYYKGGGTNSGYWPFPTQSQAWPGNAVGGLANQVNILIWADPYIWSVTQSGSYSPTQNYLTEVGAFINSSSAYGTFDQGGNLDEWNDLDALAGPVRGCRGGAFYSEALIGLYSSDRFTNAPDFSGGLGFRVATSKLATNVVLILEKAGSLTNAWLTVPITSNMITADGELNMGTMTNTNEFYRLKIRAFVQ